ncbi:tetratricopeptide repeat protein [Opitutus sp. ER46]|uniref:tetratricopeptide repeat protein n=1 Tax=Opitutus sp. ER46 TaxID=2161864 RepID=UPI000D3170D1|nr:tetratricopeptide repeat protein [Opitutus sp. ER46]PTX97967.1 hypothetical protein DB354_06775 [Opitutus sp. ER46]
MDARVGWLGALVLLLVVALAYANSLNGPFVYDDRESVVYNPTIRTLWPPTALLQTPGDGATASGRPVLNFSFALNFAAGRLDARGYHAVNIAIHLAAALTFFGLVRRTLARLPLGARLGDAAGSIALAAAALWAVHPLHTEAVTYIVQRAESLMALWYLLVLYAFSRSVEAAKPGRWLVLAWVACLLGMATKENMVSAPLLVLLYDRTYVSGGFGAAWRARRRFYLALAATWGVLAYLVASTGGNRGGSAGMGVGVEAFGYLATQVPALARYLGLSVWPYPLIFEYGPVTARFDALYFAQAALVFGALGATAWGVWRRRAWSVPAVLGWAVLAPTCLVPGTTQYIVEHRMYLPLAAGLCLIVPLAAWVSWRRLAIGVAALVVGLGVLTAARNRAYASAVTLWSDTVAKRPNNAVAYASLGAALREAGRETEAVAAHRRALELNPRHIPALGNMGLSLLDAGRPAEALEVFRLALRYQSRTGTAYYYVGLALVRLGRPVEALPYYVEALRLSPVMVTAYNDYGEALLQLNRIDEAIRQFETAIKLEEGYGDAWLNLAGARVRQGRLAEAQAAFARGAALRPRDGETQVSWGNLLLLQGHPAEALAAMDAAVAERRTSATVHHGRAMVLTALGRLPEAIAEYEEAIRLQPDYAEAHNNLGNALLTAERLPEAVARYEHVLTLNPEHALAHNNLGLALARLGRVREALPHFEEAVRLAPDLDDARKNRARARAQLGLD